MALSVAHHEHLERLIECAVCMDIANDPRRLPCGHSFCFSCLQGLWTSSQPTSKVRCPQCRKDHWLGYEGPRSIPKDFIIDQIKEMLASMAPGGTAGSPEGTRSSRCEFCLSTFPNTASYLYCLDCDSLICKECSEKHRCSKGTSKPVIKLDFQCSLICSSHKHPVRYICDVCNSNLCKRCQVQGVCFDHDLFDVFLGRFLNEEPVAKGGPKRQPKAKPKYTGGVYVGLTESNGKTKQSPESKKTQNKQTPPKQAKLRDSPPQNKPGVPNVAVIMPKGMAKVKPIPTTRTETVNITPTVTCVVTRSTSSSIVSPPQPQKPPTTLPQTVPTPAIISPTPAFEEYNLPWKKELSSKGRSVAILPSGDFVILTEKCVYLIDKDGNQLDSYSGIEDPWGVTFWSHNQAVVITERRQRRLAVFTMSPKKQLHHTKHIKVNAKAPSTGLLSVFKSPDAGPMAVAALNEGELAVTTARVSGEAVTYLHEVIVYNVSGREQFRWLCDPAPQGVTSVNSYIFLSMRNCVKVFTKEGSPIQEFGDKRLLFDPGCLCPYSNQEVMIAHRKSYICDNVSVWRISKWGILGQRQGHLVEMSEIENGPIMGIMANENILIIVSEKSVSCQDIKKLYLKRF